MRHRGSLFSISSCASTRRVPHSSRCCLSGSFDFPRSYSLRFLPVLPHRSVLHNPKLDTLLHLVNAIDENVNGVAHRIGFTSALSDNLPRIFVEHVAIV